MSLGVGMYQHDLSTSKLETRLDEVVTRIVSEVGVNVNTASKQLLCRVSGLNRRVASAIYDRARVKPFQYRQSLLEVKGLGKKMYAQCAGFLRIPNGECAYDNTNVHPESYDVAACLDDNLTVEQTAEETKRSIEDVETILRYLESPGNLADPRNNIPIPEPRTGPLSMKDLKSGTMLSGVVSNRMPYGLFVDIGVETDALLHFGKLSHNHRIRQLGVSSRIQVKVESVDMRRQRISIVPADDGPKKTTVVSPSKPWRTKNEAKFASQRDLEGEANKRVLAMKRKRNQDNTTHTKKRRKKE